MMVSRAHRRFASATIVAGLVLWSAVAAAEPSIVVAKHTSTVRR